tara:strand:- start:885 stop:2240 length:1356 start_codon:yes stop_codon:yes gene_type:complete
MELKLSWLNSRRSLIFASILDFFLFSYLFLNNFKFYILNKTILIFLFLINAFIWIISSYIVGRYANRPQEKIEIFIHKFFQTLLTIIFSIFFSLFIFRIFWNWEYMNFGSFSNFLNYFFDLYLKVFLLSGSTQFLISIYLSKKYKKKSIWLFLGNLEREKYFKAIIGPQKKFKIKFFEKKYLKDNVLNAKGIIIDEEEISKKENIKFLIRLKNIGIKFIGISNWCERYLNRYPSEIVKISEIIEGKFNYNENSFKGRIKRIGESFISIIILLITLPILVISSIFIKIEDGGPIFYTQIRNGFEGKAFKILKLRTMIIDAEKNGAQWSNISDNRITKVGRILRKLRIDELPQLLLVLSGEMSLIGPRPERPKIDILLRENISNYDLRYCIKPGISGWAQVNCPYGASIDDAKLKLSYDLYYIKNFSTLLDLMILLKTLRLVLNAKGSKPVKN